MNLLVIFELCILTEAFKLLMEHVIRNFNTDDKLPGCFGLLFMFFSSFLVILVQLKQISIPHENLPLPDRSHHPTRSRIVDLGKIGGLSNGTALRAQFHH